MIEDHRICSIFCFKGLLSQYLIPKPPIEIRSFAPINPKPHVPAQTITRPIPIREIPHQNQSTGESPLKIEIKREPKEPGEKVKRGRGRPRKHPAPPTQGKEGITHQNFTLKF